MGKKQCMAQTLTEISLDLVAVAMALDELVRRFIAVLDKNDLFMLSEEDEDDGQAGG